MPTGYTAADQEADTQVTDAMANAGVAVLWSSGIVDGRVEADKLVVAEIFRVMSQAQAEKPISFSELLEPLPVLQSIVPPRKPR